MEVGALSGILRETTNYKCNLLNNLPINAKMNNETVYENNVIDSGSAKN